MEEEKKLYPSRLCSVEDIHPWGKEEFRLADLGYRDTVLRDGWLAGTTMAEMMETYLDRVVGDNVFEWYGQQFPFQIKFIKVHGKMPLRVSPNDELAAQRYDLLGKEKVWYVLKAGTDAKIFCGFRKDVQVSDFYAACADGSVAEMLHSETPHAGQAIHIAPGTPHCAWGDIEIVEVSEASPLDFCLCTWGEDVSEAEFDPNLGLVESLDFIDYKTFKPGPHDHHDHEHVVEKLAQLPQFTLSKVLMNDALHIYTEQFDSCLAYTCISGEFDVQLEGSFVVVKEGETVLIPAECPDFILAPRAKGTVALEAMVEHRDEVDSYTGETEDEHHHHHHHDDEDFDEDECNDGDCDCGHHHHHHYHS